MVPDLTEYMWIAWIVLALIFVIIELTTLEFTFLMLAAGTLIGGLGVNLLGGPWWLQVSAAAVISALLIFTIRPLLLRSLRRSSALQPTNVDAIAGLGGRMASSFVGDRAEVRLDNGELWTVSPASADLGLSGGDRVVVTAVRGAMVEVAPAPTASESPHPTDSTDRSAD
ncbi:NfeD family protein [Microbacterium sp. bgisy203]|uniref:NfeD family protein n=1 Tax=Microbacterium sp. bgisy203 TaxID=3413799 RepID=UPI003D70CEF8